jgi:hypothetical protein
MALPAGPLSVDLHGVTKWSKLGIEAQGESLDVLLADAEAVTYHVRVTSYEGYTASEDRNTRTRFCWCGRIWTGAPGVHGPPAGPGRQQSPVRLAV